MNASKLLKTIFLAAVFGIHLVLALCLWLCGRSGNIMLGILLIAFYRLSLWFTPLAVTVICWFPTKAKIPLHRRLLFYFVLLLLCGGLFVLCYFLFGNWY